MYQFQYIYALCQRSLSLLHPGFPKPLHQLSLRLIWRWCTVGHPPTPPTPAPGFIHQTDKYGCRLMSEKHKSSKGGCCKTSLNVWLTSSSHENAGAWVLHVHITWRQQQTNKNARHCANKTSQHSRHVKINGWGKKATRSAVWTVID